MIKLGLIGLGHMGSYHASVSSTLADATLIAVADPNPEQLAKVKNKNVIKSESFLDWLDLVDAVIIAVPTDYHYAVAKQCLERKKHILIEKPITKNFEEAVELFNLAKQNNCTLHIGHVERFNGAVQEIKKIISKPYLIECHRIGPFTHRVQNDSVVLDLMIHDLDIVLNIVDSEIEQATIVGNKIRTDFCDLASVLIKFKSGCVANITASRVSQIKKRTLTIHQEDAFIELDFTTQDISIHRHASSSVKVSTGELKYRQEGTVERLFVYKENPLKSELEHFIEAIASGNNRRQEQQDLLALELTLDLEQRVLNA